MSIQKPPIEKYSDNNFSARIQWSDGFIQNLNGLVGIGGDLQSWLDQSIVNGMQPYMPLLTGAMIQSMVDHTDIGSGIIRVVTPYALRQYWEGREPGESQTGALRGRLYFVRYMNDHQNDLERGLQERLNRGIR